MVEGLFEQIDTALSRADAAVTDLKNAIRELLDSSPATLDASAPIQPGTRSLTDIFASFSVAKDIAMGFSGSAALPLMPEARLRSLAQTSAELTARLEAVTAQLRSIQSVGTVTLFDNNSHTATVANGSTISLRQQLITLNETYDTFLDSFQYLSQSLRVKGGASLNAVASNIGALIGELQSRNDELRLEIAGVRKIKNTARKTPRK